MNTRMIGAMLVVTGCGAVGFYMAMTHKQQIRAMRELLGILDYMVCELQYRMTPLPELCKKIGQVSSSGHVGFFFMKLSEELKSQISPHVNRCVEMALQKSSGLPHRCKEYLKMLGTTLGQFDLDGQLKGIQGVYAQMERELEQMEKGRLERIRSYQTLGLCAGAALAILLM